MPTYEYECSVCDFHFERKQGFDEELVAMCPKCEGKARRVLRSIPIIFRGSGFYITDSRKASDTEKGGEEKPGKGKPEGKEG